MLLQALQEQQAAAAAALEALPSVDVVHHSLMNTFQSDMLHMVSVPLLERTLCSGWLNLISSFSDDPHIHDARDDSKSRSLLIAPIDHLTWNASTARGRLQHARGTTDAARC